MMELVREQSVNITFRNDSLRAVNALFSVIGESCSQKKTLDKVKTCVLELSKNIAMHSKGGILTISLYKGNNSCKLVIQSRNNIVKRIDFEYAFTEGYTTAGSLGSGLGIINDIMDYVNIETVDNELIIICEKTVELSEQQNFICPFDIGLATRPHPRMKVNGDSYFTKQWDDKILISVIDGLGHGQYAERASTKAKNYLANHYTIPVRNMFPGISRACRSTRGVVVGIMKINFVKDYVEYGGIGNISVMSFGGRKNLILHNQRGILGIKTIFPPIMELSLDECSTIWMFSDGISSSKLSAFYPKSIGMSAMETARFVLNHYSKDNDDATIIVLKRK